VRPTHKVLTKSLPFISLSAKNVQNESDFMPPYNFSISPTCGFAFRHRTERVFMSWYQLIWHLKGQHFLEIWDCFKPWKFTQKHNFHHSKVK